MKTAYGLNIPVDLSEICQPDRMAILIYDMQVGIVSQIDDGIQIAKGCQELLAAARGKGYRVFYTRHLFLPHASAGVGQLRRAMIWQRRDNPLETKPLYAPASEAAQIVPQLHPLDSEVVVDKITMSAFEGTYLNLAFRDLGVQAFAIAGIALEVGIEPTVRQALDLNYIPVLISDLCGSRTEKLHQRSIESLNSTGEVVVVSIRDLLSQLTAHR
jgi:nicotinamidase-related amidase